jgi:hypothetical protein
MLREKAPWIATRYEHSVPKALMAAFPEFEWKLWKFRRAPDG